MTFTIHCPECCQENTLSLIVRHEKVYPLKAFPSPTSTYRGTYGCEAVDRTRSSKSTVTTCFNCGWCCSNYAPARNIVVRKADAPPEAKP